MSEALINLTIDGRQVSVPTGTLIVDAAKAAGIDIPVFCYHPKLDPVGMCRMCLVEVGRPVRDRASGEAVLDESGQPEIHFGPKLETACTAPVSEGMVVRVSSEAAVVGRKDILEYLLISHPLDCPICDKGGECPLQNLTMGHGPGESRFHFEDKIDLDKCVPLGELIILDRERCIQCARCTRFQDEIAGEPVIGFYQRGRSIQIVTFSEPGFDSVFSGNTTDICPVGALTTSDFRFGARPWELNSAASLCPHCPVGCNLTINTRREAKAGGVEVVKRVMPRQNEWVNEIWICDKGRFGHHFAASPERLTRPLVRKDGQLVEATWEEALALAARGFSSAGGGLVGLASGRASNEDLFNFRKLVEGRGGQALLADGAAGGDLIQQVGMASGGNLQAVGEGDAILVIASDLHQEAPIWWLRVKQAAERGAKLIVANARSTPLDRYATLRLAYAYGRATHTALGLLQHVQPDERWEPYSKEDAVQQAAEMLAEAGALVILFGSEGLDYDGSDALSRALAGLVQVSGHAGKANSGLVAVWPRANTQGAWDMGLRPARGGVGQAASQAAALYILASDPLGDQPGLGKLFGETFSVVQDLFLTSTAQQADVVLPAQSFLERQGSWTSGERRVQRFYPVLPPVGACLPDWQITARLAARLGLSLEDQSPSAVMRQIAAEIGDYAQVSFPRMAQVELQWPMVGGTDLYYGGTSYKNAQGLGVSLGSAAEREPVTVELLEPADVSPGEGLLLVPIHVLYDQGTTILPSTILKQRMATPHLRLHPDDAGRLGCTEAGMVDVSWDGIHASLPVRIESQVPAGVGLIPRSVGPAPDAPVWAAIKTVE
jgi:NADH-quinone oxidoreductase subunit G